MTVGTQRQYTGTAGRTENAQVATCLAYASPAGSAPPDQRRRAGLLPRPRPPPGAAGPAGVRGRIQMEGRGRIRWREGTRRPRRAPGPLLDVLAPLDHPGARPRLLVRPGRNRATQPRPRPAHSPGPQRNPQALHRPGPAADCTRKTAALVPLETLPPSHRPSLPLPATRAHSHMITKCRWSIKRLLIAIAHCLQWRCTIKAGVEDVMHEYSCPFDW